MCGACNLAASDCVASDHFLACQQLGVVEYDLTRAKDQKNGTACHGFRSFD